MTVMEILLLAAASIFLLALLYFAFRFLDVDEDFTDKKDIDKPEPIRSKKDEALNQLIETVLGGLIIGFNAIQNAKLGEEFENDEYVLGYMTGITNYINTIMNVQQGSKEEIETFTYIFKNLFQKPDDAYNKLAKYFYDDHKLFHQGMKDGSEELYDVFSGKKQYIYDFGKYLKEKYGWNK